MPDSETPANHGSTSFEVATLTALASCPVEVIWEILSSCEPRELVALGQTNRWLRHTIESAGDSLWKQARSNFTPEVPSPPGDLSERTWAAALFLNTDCQVCGAPAKPAQPLFCFYLLSHLCAECNEEQWIPENKTVGFFPEVDSDVLSLVPTVKSIYRFDCAPMNPWLERYIAHVLCSERPPTATITPPISTKTLYWRPLLSKEIYTMKRMKTEEQNGVIAPSDIFHYRVKRLALLRSIEENRDLYYEWYNEYLQRLSREFRETTKKRRREIFRRLRRLGYDDEEFEVLDKDPEEDWGMPGTHPLTDEEYASMLPRLEAAMRPTRCERALKERLKSMIKILSSYIELLPADERPLCPSIPDLLELPMMFAWLMSHDYSVIDPDVDGPWILAYLPQEIAEWKTRRRTELTQELKNVEIVTSSVDPWTLASSIFECTQISRHCKKKVLFGWEGVLRHWHCCRKTSLDPRPCVYPSTSAMHVAATLVELCGLDPNTTTVSDMDSLGVHFYCDDCSRVDGRLGRRIAYSWRDAVLHASRKMHLSSLWILNEEQDDWFAID